MKNANAQTLDTKRLYEIRGNIRALKTVIIKPLPVSLKTLKARRTNAYALGDFVTPVYWTKKIIAGTLAGHGFQLFRELL